MTDKKKKAKEKKKIVKSEEIYEKLLKYEKDSRKQSEIEA